MGEILLSKQSRFGSTVVSNTFIDNYMAEANGTYVKVYFYLLRFLSSADERLSISFLADMLEGTEKDILRALNYWEKKGVLVLTRSSDGSITNIAIADLDKPAVEAPKSNTGNVVPFINTAPSEKKIPKVHTKPNYTPLQINQLTEIKEVDVLLKDIEELLMHPLQASEQQLVLYFYESLGFSPSLIVFLYSYCIEHKKTDLRYVEKVALSWDEKDINTVEKAKEFLSAYNTAYLAVSKAFGLNRLPVLAEQKYIDSWVQVYKFDISIIVEACNRTILATQKPSFEYANSVLLSWLKKRVSTLEDIAAIDEARAHSINNLQDRKLSQRPVNNRFNQFPQRSYSNEELMSIEQQLLSKARVD